MAYWLQALQGLHCSRFHLCSHTSPTSGTRPRSSMAPKWSRKPSLRNLYVLILVVLLSTT